ncbi:MAG: nucleoside-diphosphate kinase [Candidatus Spechtbacterales bacterium]|nr:nucleoside-diphosphate kinase [Candidatus Spechtbacterales bacterium]
MDKKTLDHFKNERTLVVIKPDGVQRSLVGEVIGRYESMGLKLVGMKMLVADADHIEKHYTLDPGWKKSVGEKSIAGYKKKGLEPPSEDPIEVADAVLERLKKYMVAGPVVAMVWQGAHAAEIVRKITGGTEPLSSDVGTIRGDFVMDSFEMADADDRSVRNIVHASGNAQEAEAEIDLWFDKDELVEYTHVQDKILYDVDLDGILD